MHELYTFGAPSVTKDPITARGNCVPGLRLYTENVMKWRWRHPSDFAAMVNQDLGHPKMNALMLNNRKPEFWDHNGGADTAKYWYMPCNDSEGNDKDEFWWPKNQKSETKIHGMNENYFPRLKYFFFGTPDSEQNTTSVRTLWTQPPTDNGVPEDMIKSALLYGTMAQMNHDHTMPDCTDDSDCNDCADDVGCTGQCHWGKCDGWVTNAMQNDGRYAIPTGWELVNQGEVWSGVEGSRDRDNIKLYKLVATNECVFTFEGSNINKWGGLWYDLGRFALPGAHDMVTWCGKDNLHRGTKDELWTIMHSAAYEDFKPQLATCQKVTCAGHSLGGALCDMWTHLANNGVEDSTDSDCWTKLAWW